MPSLEDRTLFRGISKLSETNADRVVLDIGNTRLKWGLLSADGFLSTTGAVFLRDDQDWETACERLVEREPFAWAIASVNPAVADRIKRFLESRTDRRIVFFRSARDVSVPHRLETPETTGADRAAAVLAALDRRRDQGPGLVVCCGTAVTLEAIDADGVWIGGAIAPGLALLASSLSSKTAQLPELNLDEPRETPPAWGRSTRDALHSGLHWGGDGLVRGLVERAKRSLLDEAASDGSGSPWLFWTGGDAERFSRSCSCESSSIVKELILEGVALAGFGKAREAELK